MRGFSSACDRNKEPILAILKQYLTEGNLLEIGSGTVQHAEYFAPHFPHIKWQLSEHKSNFKNIKDFYPEIKNNNILAPKELTIGEDDFPKTPYQYVYTANTLHIMSWKEVKTFIKLCGKRLREGSLVIIYGPFKYHGQFTAPSNENFDQSLKERNPESGIRDFEKVTENFEKVGIKLISDHKMPANNQLLIFERKSFN